MKNEMHTRQNHRLENYDYSSVGAYFVTICTSDRKQLFWSDHVGASIARPSDVVLSGYGEIVLAAINRISHIYPAVTVEGYVIMPDHIHLMIRIHCDQSGRPMVAPTLGNIVRQLKGCVTKQIGHPIWQKLFYDHVIRNDGDYEKTLKYMYDNPMRWVSKQNKDGRLSLE